MLEYEEARMRIIERPKKDIVRTSFETDDNTGDGNWDEGGLPKV